MSRLSKGLKEGFSIFLIIGFCVAIALPSAGFSQWASEVTQSVVSSAIPSNSNPNNGDQITVAINIDMTGVPAPNDNLGSFTATLNWDPTVLSFVSHGGILQGFVGVVNTLQAGNGLITFNGANPLGASGAFDVLVVTFDVTGANGTSTTADLEYSAMAAAFTFTNLLPFLTVNDALINVGPITMNLPPQLTSIPNQTMDENSTLNVPVTATDPDGNNLTLSVNNLPAFGNLTDNGDGTGTISFTTTFDNAGSYPMIEVIATDDGTPSMADTVYFDLTVNNVNRAPALAPISDQTMDENTTLDVSISATDPDNDNITLSVNNLPAFGSLTDNGDGTGTIHFAPLTGDAGTYPNIEVTATDDGTPSPLSDMVSFTLTVNQPPPQSVVSSAIPSNANPNSGDQITVAINMDMTGMLPPNENLGSFTGTINWDPTVLSFVSHGGILQGFVGVVNTTQAGTGLITFNGANPLGATGVFDVLVITFDVSGAGGTSTALDLEYSAMAAAFSFTDLLPFLTVNDGMVTVAGVPVNNPPQLTPISNQTMDENTTLDVPVASTDPDGDNITLAVNNLPAFGSFTDNGDGTGTISFAPGYNDAGTYPMIEVIATDNGTPPAADTVYFDLTVNDVNRAPALSPIADQTVAENATLNVPVSSTDPDGDNLTLSANNLPAFGSLTDNGDGTGTISFAPLTGDAGTYPNIEVISADDGTPSLSDTVSFTLTVTAVAPQQVVSSAIPSNSTPNQGDQITVAINFDMTGMQPPNENLGSFTATLNWDPTVLSFVSHGGILQGFVGVVNTTQAGNGMITFNGANPLGATGVFDVLVITFDAAGAGQTALDLEYSAMAAALSFTDLLPFLVVNDGLVTVAAGNNPPQITPIADQTMTEGQTLNVPVSATDPDQNSITLSANNLPAFGSLTDNGDGTGNIAFAPGFNDAGVYPNIEITATDDGTPQLSATTSFTLTVNDSVVADADPPLCALTAIIPGPPKAIQVTVQDLGSGLGTVNVLSASNAIVTIPGFTPGTTSPVVVTATKIDQNQGSSVTLEVFDVAGNSTVCDPVYTTIAAVIPNNYELKQNFPNPFNPTTTIHFSIAEDLEGVSNVSLKVFDLTGREIKTLINDAIQPGTYSVEWDGTNNHGEQVAGGVYIYRLVAGDFTATKKMILMK